MSYYLHHAIVVTASGRDLDAARTQALELGMLVTEIVEDSINVHRSFMVAPDGSKEGWPESDQGDSQRKDFIRWLRESRLGLDRRYLNWVEIQYGCSDYDIRTQVLNDSEEGHRAFQVLRRLGVTEKIPDDLHDEIQDSL